MDSFTNDTQSLAGMVELYRRLLKFTLNLLDNPLPEEDELESVFSKRTDLITRIQEIEKGLPRDEQTGRMLVPGDSPSENERATRLFEDLETVLNQLKDSDRSLSQKMEKEVGVLKGELSRVSQGQKVLKGYSRYRGGISYYVSTKS